MRQKLFSFTVCVWKNNVCNCHNFFHLSVSSIRACVNVCACVIERERECVWVCVCVSDRDRLCVCVCVSLHEDKKDMVYCIYFREKIFFWLWWFQRGSPLYCRGEFMQRKYAPITMFLFSFQLYKFWPVSTIIYGN